MSLPTTALPEFQDRQIIYLQHGTMRLYAETIQIIKLRQLCWARPLALIQLPDELGVNLYQPLILCDLRQGSDLLLPISLFCIALDIDAIPVITQLNDPEGSLPAEPLRDKSQLSPPFLQNFVRQVWQAHPEQFSQLPIA
jgi:hypothetical protein